MKKCLILSFALSSLSLLGKDVPSKVKSVIVFQTRAEVTRTASTSLTAGAHEVVLTGISSATDANSIRVKGTGSVVILGISYRQDYLNPDALPESLQRLKDRLSALEDELAKLNNRSGALTTEANLLVNNQQFKGTNTNLSVGELRAMAEYFRTRTQAISNEQLSIKKEINQTKEELTRVKKQFDEQSRGFKQNAGEIVINVEASRTTNLSLSVTYLVRNAGWRAEYDLRSPGAGEPLRLNYKAKVYQQTGEHWEEVKLTLSTGDPTATIEKPYLSPQYVNLYDPSSHRNSFAQSKRSLDYSNDFRAAPPSGDGFDDLLEAEVEESVIDELDVSTVTQTFYTNYEISQPYDLPSSAEPVNVNIRDQELLADYEYQSVPKLRNRVFLVAKVKNWGELVLLPGPMNLYFEGGYVGESSINPLTTEDNLPISLGFDPGLTVDRERIQDLTSRKTIGSNITEVHAFELKVRNNKKEQVDLVLEDQLPVIQNSEIKLEVLDTGGAQVEAATGKLTWKISLAPGKEAKRTLRYELKYPKNKRLQGH